MHLAWKKTAVSRQMETRFGLVKPNSIRSRRLKEVRLLRKKQVLIEQKKIAEMGMSFREYKWIRRQ